MFIIIVGCGRVGSMLASDLSKEGHNVTVIDKNHENLEKLGSGFNGVTIEGIGIDEEVLIKAGIKEADAFLVVTHEDNINIMAAQIAKNIFHVPKVIARNYKPELNEFYTKLGLDTVYPSVGTVETIKNKILFDNIEVITQLTEENLIFLKLVAAFNLDNAAVQDLENEHQIKIIQIQSKNKKEYPTKSRRVCEGDVLIIAIEKELLNEFKEIYWVKG